MARAIPTQDELISSIKRSALINVLIEGPDDVMIYEHLREKITLDISILPCGGRSTLIEIYKRKSEFSDKKVVFIADQDVWIFGEKPADYEDIIFTSGYSIENDLFDFGQSLILKLLNVDEKAIFFDTLNNY